MISNERLWHEASCALASMHIPETMVGYDYLLDFIMLFVKDSGFKREGIGYLIRYACGVETERDAALERDILSSCNSAIKRSKKVIGDTKWDSIFGKSSVSAKEFCIRIAESISERICDGGCANVL